MATACGGKAAQSLRPGALDRVSRGRDQSFWTEASDPDGSTWGLFRHYWVVAKLLLTTVVTVVLLLQTAQIAYMANLAVTPLSSADHLGLRMSLVVHAAGGLLVLLTTTTLSI